MASNQPAAPSSHLDNKTEETTVAPESSSCELKPRCTPHLSDADGVLPLFKRFRLENSLMNELSSIFESDEFLNPQAFGARLSPISQDIVKQELEVIGRSPFHYKVAFMTIHRFLDKHEALHEEEAQNIFDVLLHASSSLSDEEVASALYVLAVLFVLTGPLLFTRRKTLTFLDRVLNTVPKERTDKLDKVRCLALRCLLWSFLHIVEWGIFANSTWQVALHIIEPHLVASEIPQIVAFVINSLCPAKSSGCEFPGARLAAMLVHTLITRRKDETSRALVFKLLRQLLLCGPEEWPSAPDNASFTLQRFLDIEYLVHNVTFDASYHRRPPTRAVMMRDLSSAEIGPAWDFLASAWLVAVYAEVQSGSRNLDRFDHIELAYDTTEMWRVLLHTCGKGASAIEEICNAHVKLILQAPKVENGTNDMLFHVIQTATQLWLVAMNELDIPSRTAVGEMILRNLMEKSEFYEGFTGKLRIVWFKLFEELVFCDPLKALSAISSIRVHSGQKLLIQQRIWCDLMHFIVVPEVRHAGVKSHFSICELVDFLRFPYKMEFENTDDYFHLLWDTLLRRAFVIAQERRRSVMVLELMQEVARSCGMEAKGDDDIQRIREEENFMISADRTRRPKRRFTGRGRQF